MVKLESCVDKSKLEFEWTEEWKGGDGSRLVGKTWLGVPRGEQLWEDIRRALRAPCQLEGNMSSPDNMPVPR